MNRKNYAIGRNVSIWWNEAKDPTRNGFYSVQIKHHYKDAQGADIEQKISLFTDDAIKLAAELEIAVRFLLAPREIVRRDEQP